jgi:cysteine synthase
VNVYVKLEFLNRGATRTGLPTTWSGTPSRGTASGGCVVECSSGNTAIAVAFVAARLGLKAVITAPEETSPAKLGRARNSFQEVFHDIIKEMEMVIL